MISRNNISIVYQNSKLITNKAKTVRKKLPGPSKSNRSQVVDDVSEEPFNEYSSNYIDEAARHHGSTVPPPQNSI